MSTTSEILKTSTLLSALQAKIGEDFGEQWKKVDKIRNINSAIREICEEFDFRWMQESHEFTGVEGQTEYQLPDRLKTIVSIRVNNSSYPYTYFDIVDYEAGVGEPAYSIYGKNILINVAAGDTVKIRYSRYLPSLEGNQDEVSGVPAYLEGLVTYLAAEKCFEEEEDIDQAISMRNKYEVEKQKHIDSQSKMISDKFPGFRPITGLVG